MLSIAGPTNTQKDGVKTRSHYLKFEFKAITIDVTTKICCSKGVLQMLVEHPSEYWRVSLYPWPCARGVAPDVMM
eukprot:598240-Pelagomonas_calceolata.AAC.1